MVLLYIEASYKTKIECSTFPTPPFLQVFLETCRGVVTSWIYRDAMAFKNAISCQDLRNQWKYLIQTISYFNGYIIRGYCVNLGC